MKNKKIIWPVILALLALIVTGLIQAKRKSAVSGEIVIRVIRSGTTPSEWELTERLTGIEILKEEGVKIKEIYGSSAGWLPMMILMTDRVDVAGGGWPGWINARARGGKIKAVIGSGGNSYQYWPGKKAGLLVLADSGIHSIKDLEGKTIAVNVLGLTGDYVVRTMLRKNGIPLDRVQIIAVPAENQEQVLRSRQVDAVADTTAGGPNFDRILDRGGIRVVPGTSKSDILGDAESTGTGFRDEFIRKHPETVRKYVKAVERAKRIIWDEFSKDPVRVRKIYGELVKEKGGNVDLAKYYLPPVYLPKYKFITGGEIQLWIGVMEAEGHLKPGQIRAEDIYTNELNPYYQKYVEKNGGKQQ